MESLQNKFFYLLRLGLWGKTQETCSFCISPEEWISIYQMSCKQTVQGIIYDALEFLPKEQQPPKEVLLKWVVEVDRIERANKKQILELTKIQDFFCVQNGLNFKLQKGQSIAQHYRNRLHRVCGDYDLWFGNGELVEKANQMIEAQNIHLQRGEHNDAIYYWNGIEIEHHSMLIELSNPFLQNKLKEWESKTYNTDSIELSSCANLFLQTTHILKHLLTEGIGLRQICDFGVSITSLDYNEKEFQRLCKQFGVYKWTCLLCSLLHQILGITEEKLPLPYHKDASALLNEIWETGNFGYKDTRFGSRPTGKWRSKFYTLRIFLEKMKLFFFYAPGESFWRISNLISIRIAQFLHLKENRPNYI